MRKPLLVVKGVGSDRAFAFSEGPAQVPSDFDLIPLVDRPPQPTETSVDYLTADADISAMSWTMSATGLVSELFMEKQILSAGYYTSPVGVAANSIELAPKGQFQEGDYIYVKSETMLLGEKLDEGEDYDRFSVGTSAGGGSRGVFSSREMAHSKGREVNDRVYLRPRIKGRECFVFLETLFLSEEDIIFRGIVEGVQDSEDMAAIQVDVRDSFGLFVKKELNEEPYRFVESARSAQVDKEGYVWASSLIQKGNRKMTGTEPLPISDKELTLEYGGALGITASASYTSQGQQKRRMSSVTRHPYRSPNPVETGQQVHKFVDDEDYDGEWTACLCYGRQMVAEGGDYVGDIPDTVEEDHRHHPLSALLVGLLSGPLWDNGDYDHWGRQWGCRIPEEMVDVEGIESLIEETQDVEVHRALWGYEEETWSASKWIKDHTILWGFFPCWNEQGQFTVRRLEAITDPDYSVDYRDVEYLSEAQDQNLYDSAEAVTAERGLPWEDWGDVKSADMSEGEDLWRPKFGRSELSVDASMAPPQDEVGEGRLTNYLERVLRWAKFDITSFRLRVVGRDKPIPAGATIEIQHPGNVPGNDGVFWDRDGNRQSESFLGLVTSSQKDWDTGAIEIEVDHINQTLRDPTPKLIAPGARTTDIDPDSELLVIERYPLNKDLVPFFESIDVENAKFVLKSYNDRAEVEFTGWDASPDVIGFNVKTPMPQLLWDYEDDNEALVFTVEPNEEVGFEEYIALVWSYQEFEERPYYV